MANCKIQKDTIRIVDVHGVLGLGSTTIDLQPLEVNFRYAHDGTLSLSGRMLDPSRHTTDQNEPVDVFVTSNSIVSARNLTLEKCRAHLSEVKTQLTEIDTAFRALCERVVNGAEPFRVYEEATTLLTKGKNIEDGAQRWMEAMHELEVKNTFREKLRMVDL